MSRELHCSMYLLDPSIWVSTSKVENTKTGLLRVRRRGTYIANITGLDGLDQFSNKPVMYFVDF